MRPQVVNALRAVAAIVLAAGLAADAVAQVTEQQLDENCTISVLNRNVRANPDGSWVLPNVPANFGFVRARVTCIIDGRTVSGESERFLIPANGVVNRPRITFGLTTPIPRSVTVTSNVATLTALGDTAQLTVTALYADGNTRDVTSGAGTQFTVSNSAIATLSDAGLVTAVSSGTVVIQATIEGASGMTSIRVAPPGVDSDSDGMPDEYEVANGLNPSNRTDALEDPDHDGLANLQEYQLGTDPRNADVDADGLMDGQEITRGTNPLLWDTDGDGVSDGLEVEVATDPLDRTSVNLAAVLRALRVTPENFVLTFNTIEGEASVRLTVTGTMRDGRAIDVTARGVNIASSNLGVCSFGATQGQVFAGQSGGCTITATLGALSATSLGTVRTFAPTALSFVTIPGFANNVDVSGDFAFVAAGASGLQVVDVANRLAPRVASGLGLPGNANDVKLDGSRAYVAGGAAGLHVIDITDPLTPRLLGTVDTPGTAFDVRASGNLAFVADGTGLRVVDVSNPAAPRIIGSLALTGVVQGVDVSGRRAVVTAGASLRVVDITNPAAPTLVGSVTLPEAGKDVVFNGTFAFVAAYQSSLRVVDVSNPAAPQIVGSTSTTLGGMLMDVAMAPPFVFGADVFFVNGVPIVDASVPATPIARAILDFRSFRDDDGTGVAVDGSYIYLTASRGIIENGTTGDTRLYIGQYRALEDLKGVAPTVALTAPADGATYIEGETIPFAATATDDVAVASVQFLVNGSVAFTDSSAPYQFSTMAASGAGRMTISAVAVDLASNTGTSPAVTINVIADPMTTVVGRVLGSDLQPLAGVNVAVLGRTAVTDADGAFSIGNVPTLQPAIMVNATLTVNGTLLTGTSAAVPPVRGGTTDVGDIVASSTGFEGELGTPKARCDFCDLTVPLPFPFSIAGRTYDRIHVNNGYLWTDGGDYLEAFCCDLETNTADGAGLYVNDTLPDRFVVTWYRQFTFSTGTELNTVQIILFRDGRIQFGYRGVSPGAYAEVGLFTSKRTSTTRVDLSAITSREVAAEQSVYESFNPTSNRFDLDGGFLVYTPTVTGHELRTIPDLIPPECTIVNPLNGSTLFEGEALAVLATATDDGAIQRVRLASEPGGLDIVVASAPYSAPFVVPVGASRVTFTATAYDGWQNTGVCTSTATVVPGPPPVLAITGPAAGASLTAGATIPITLDTANRVPVARVDFLVNGAVVSTDNDAPFTFLFTVPAGVNSLSFGAVATDTVGKTGSAPAVSVTVVADARTSLQGTVVDASNADAPVSGATVTATLHGITAEVFNSDATLAAMPDLSGATPSQVVLVSALNLRNPSGMFGTDPFGLGTHSSRAIRFSGTLRITEAGLHTFTLGVAEGGRLLVNGTTVVDIPKGADRFQQASGTIALPIGAAAIHVLTFDNSTPEVQLSYTPPGGSAGIVPPALLTPDAVPYQSVSQSDGTFSIGGVPTIFGPLGASGLATLNGKPARGVSQTIAPVAGGVTDVGTVRLAAFDTLYAAAFTGPTGPASFYEIDRATGAATLVGPIGFWRVSAMDTAEDGTIYAVGRNPANGRHVLLTIDRTTGAGTEIGQTGVESLGYGDTIADVSFRPADGVLFGYLEAGDGLGTLNLTTGAATALGRSFVSCCGNGLAFAPDGRLLHINEDELHVLDQTTGRATVVVRMVYPATAPDPRISSMDFEPQSGELFGFMKSDAGTFLTKIDIATGVVTTIGNRTINGLDAITWGMRR